MTRRYSGIDYDQLDNFYYQVSTFIELGELLKVDLLLRYRRDLNGNIYLKRSETIRQKEDELRKPKIFFNMIRKRWRSAALLRKLLYAVSVGFRSMLSLSTGKDRYCKCLMAV